MVSRKAHLICIAWDYITIAGAKSKTDLNSSPRTITLLSLLSIFVECQVKYSYIWGRCCLWVINAYEYDNIKLHRANKLSTRVQFSISFSIGRSRRPSQRRPRLQKAIWTSSYIASGIQPLLSQVHSALCRFHFRFAKKKKFFAAEKSRLNFTPHKTHHCIMTSCWIILNSCTWAYFLYHTLRIRVRIICIWHILLFICHVGAFDIQNVNPGAFDFFFLFLRIIT